MDGRESREKFERSDQLFREGNYGEALVLLGELDAAHPDTRNVLVPMAMCLERLGREDEALHLCKRLVSQFSDARARALADRLRLPRALPALHVDALISDHDYAGTYAIPDLGPMTAVPVPVQSEEGESRWPMAVLCGGCALLIAGLLALPLFLGGPPGGETSATTAQAMSPEETGVFIGIALFVFAYFLAAGTLTGSLALGALGKLPANTIGGIVLDVGGTILVVNLIGAVLGLLVMNASSPALSLVVTLVQFAILLYAFHRNYQLGWGGLAAFAVIYLVLSCVLIALPFLALFGVAGILAFFMG